MGTPRLSSIFTGAMAEKARKLYLSIATAGGTHIQTPKRTNKKEKTTWYSNFIARNEGTCNASLPVHYHHTPIKGFGRIYLEIIFAIRGHDKVFLVSLFSFCPLFFFFLSLFFLFFLSFCVLWFFIYGGLYSYIYV